MIRLELLGAHTRLSSALCGQCPQGPTGCCASPPGVEWADIGRIVSLGGRDWLLAQFATGDLRPGPRGLLIRRAQAQQDDAGRWPLRCAYHGPRGCTIVAEQRSATCNYYLCDDAFAHEGEGRGDPDAARGRRAHDALMSLYGRWDRALAEDIRARFPEGPAWDAAFFDWLGQEAQRLIRASRKELRALLP
jgi:hypothetical protein